MKNFLLRKNIFKIYLIIFVLLISIISISSCKKHKQNKIQNNPIIIDVQNRTIIFESMLVYNDTTKNNTVNEKYFIFYFKGYPWLKNFCIFESSATLQQLQSAIATIDWQLWDKIYTKNFSPKTEIYIFIDNEWKLLNTLMKTSFFPDKQIIFWGSYLYDDIVLNNNYQNTKCASCNFLPIEKDIFLYNLKQIKFTLSKKIEQNKYYKFKIVFK